MAPERRPSVAGAYVFRSLLEPVSSDEPEEARLRAFLPAREVAYGLTVVVAPSSNTTTVDVNWNSEDVTVVVAPSSKTTTVDVNCASVEVVVVFAEAELLPEAFAIARNLSNVLPEDGGLIPNTMPDWQCVGPGGLTCMQYPQIGVVSFTVISNVGRSELAVPAATGRLSR